MVKIILFIFISLVLGCSIVNNASQIQQSLKLESIHVEHNASYSGYISSNETADFCKTFILNESEIVTFFKQSRPATSREYAHDLIASNCYASGSFISSKGIKGTWKIDRARRGFINFTNGKSQFYYCRECKSQLFYESCDIDCVHNQ